MKNSVQVVSGIMTEILETNDKIVECVGSVSACSEEVSASCQEAMNISTKNVTEVARVTSGMVSIEECVISMALKSH